MASNGLPPMPLPAEPRRFGNLTTIALIALVLLVGYLILPSWQMLAVVVGVVAIITVVGRVRAYVGRVR